MTLAVLSVPIPSCR